DRMRRVVHVFAGAHAQRLVQAVEHDVAMALDALDAVRQEDAAEFLGDLFHGDVPGWRSPPAFPPPGSPASSPRPRGCLVHGPAWASGSGSAPRLPGGARLHLARPHAAAFAGDCPRARAGLGWRIVLRHGPRGRPTNPPPTSFRMSQTETSAPPS